ncbi:hypothetical protein KW849_14370 [Pseudomonas sp. PDM26]|uniref:hypothetical protein n=1 Tax=Pseudomonas sp. PDM26 TaxID=2854766 RepID=UPI001C454039|nr:hypothetical protein [Pseudomonas sp. PDM26]MBV7547473.1 hypothetical protein [Pseudomonas sp. PDM26]
MSHCSECGAQVEPDLVIDEILLQMKSLECNQEYPKTVEGAIDDWVQHIQESLVEGGEVDRAHLMDAKGQVSLGGIQGETGATV